LQVDNIGRAGGEHFEHDSAFALCSQMLGLIRRPCLGDGPARLRNVAAERVASRKSAACNGECREMCVQLGSNVLRIRNKTKVQDAEPT
jgi:hypothetical protein